MKRKPRSPQESIFANGLGVRIVWMAVVLALVTLGSYLWGYSAHGMDPFSPTLGLEKLEAAALADLVGPEHVPQDWSTLDEAARMNALGGAEAGSQFAVEEDQANETLAMAERIPRTIAFTVLALGQIFHVSAIHAGVERSFFRTWFTGNKFLLWAVLLTLVLQLLVIYVPFLQTTFETVPLSLTEIVVTIAISSVILFVVEIEKVVRKLGNRGEPVTAA